MKDWPTHDYEGGNPMLQTTTIHLASLRAFYAAPIRDERKAEEHRQVVALIDAVQAARDYFGQSLPYSGDADADLAQENLRAALRRFTFEGYA